MQTSPQMADGAGAEHQQYLTFRLGEETFAMPILMIKEILKRQFAFAFFRLALAKCQQSAKPAVRRTGGRIDQ